MEDGKIIITRAHKNANKWECNTYLDASYLHMGNATPILHASYVHCLCFEDLIVTVSNSHKTYNLKHHPKFIPRLRVT